MLAIPVAISIMETQPLALGLLCGAMLLVGEQASLPLDTGGMILLLLGGQWWVLLVRQGVRRGLPPLATVSAQALGVAAACALIIVTHAALLHSPPALVVALGLALWCWGRGLNWGQRGSSSEHLLRSFQVGGLVLLGVLLMTVVYLSPPAPGERSSASFHTTLTEGMLLYFFSGVMAVSLTRLSHIRREYGYRTPGESLADPTRRWLVALTLLWCGIIAAAVALEVVSFGALTTLFLELWNGLGDLLSGLLNGVAIVFHWLFPSFHLQPLPPLTRAQPSPKLPPPKVPPWFAVFLLVLRVVVVFGVGALLLFGLWKILRRWRVTTLDDSEVEIRIHLSRQTLARARRATRLRDQQDPGLLLEPLDPTSMRAHYRAFLQAMAEQGESLARRPQETPTEYQARLLVLLTRTAPAPGQGEGSLPDTVLLEELTHTYVLERYGGRRSHLPHLAELLRWIPQVGQRAAGRKTG